MKLKVTQKILVGYLAVFVLLTAFAALTLFNGKRIEATTIVLSQEKIPGLIAVSGFKSNMQLQTIHLYELYATTDLAVFNKRHQQNMDLMTTHLSSLQSLPEFKNHRTLLTELNTKQAQLTKRFVEVMSASAVDWDGAREVLSDFSKGADAIGVELDKLVESVADETLARSAASQKLTEQLMVSGLILTVVTFLGILGMAYFSNRQVAQPLRAVSVSLSDVAARKDLTYRIKQHSDDEVGDIALATNHLLGEFQHLARTLDGTAQEVNRTMTNLSRVTEDTKASMADRNVKLRSATQKFMEDIQTSSKENEKLVSMDMELHRAQMKFIQSHMTEIDEGTQATERSVKSLQSATAKLQELAENMHSQIRLLNF
ncbi:MAG: hypothetical protein ACT4OH_02220 [Methylophilaceae bacterium]